MRSERVVVVSLQKSGTHLVAELLLALGYDVIGMVRLGADDWSEVGTVLSRRSPPEAIRERVFAGIADVAFAPDERAAVAATRHTPEGAAAVDEAMRRVYWSWAVRLGMPVENRYSYAHARQLEVKRAGEILAAPFDQTPRNLAWFLHEAPLGRIDGAFLNTWTLVGKPAIVFNYRDPRDVLVSYVNYLLSRSRSGRVGRFADYGVYRRLLRALPDEQARYRHAILDPGFPGHDDFANALWLLRHPNVCPVRYEDLVGASGGGSDEARDATVSRVMRHLHVDGDPTAVAKQLYNEAAFSFRKGQIGEWRRVLDPEVQAAFLRARGDLVAAYGYPET